LVIPSNLIPTLMKLINDCLIKKPAVPGIPINEINITDNEKVKTGAVLIAPFISSRKSTQLVLSLYFL
ncbi:unnamed protein product, partial [marine sediment metagenome]